jgi:hypothetical protein
VVRDSAIGILSSLVGFLEFLQLKLGKTIYKLKMQRVRELIAAEVEQSSQSIEEFLKHPENMANSVLQPEYRDVVETYFILKQATGQFEAYQKELPTQIFNEMRNALDHFMRSLCNDGTITETRDAWTKDHLKKMKAHLTRATLDSMKLVVGFLNDDINDRHARFSDKEIGLVDSGEYVKTITRLHTEAQNRYIKAREADYMLGTHHGDRDVLQRYLEAVAAHRVAHNFQLENYGKLKWAKFQLVTYVALGGLLLFIAEVISRAFESSIVDGFLHLLKKLSGIA